MRSRSEQRFYRSNSKGSSKQNFRMFPGFGVVQRYFSWYIFTMKFSFVRRITSIRVFTKVLVYKFAFGVKNSVSI